MLPRKALNYSFHINSRVRCNVASWAILFTGQMEFESCSALFVHLFSTGTAIPLQLLQIDGQIRMKKRRKKSRRENDVLEEEEVQKRQESIQKNDARILLAMYWRQSIIFFNVCSMAEIVELTCIPKLQFRRNSFIISEFFFIASNLILETNNYATGSS